MMILLNHDSKLYGDFIHSGLIKNKVLRLYLGYSDSDNHFKYEVSKTLTLGWMGTFLAKIKNSIVKHWVTRY